MKKIILGVITLMVAGQVQAACDNKPSNSEQLYWVDSESAVVLSQKRQHLISRYTGDKGELLTSYEVEVLVCVDTSNGLEAHPAYKTISLVGEKRGDLELAEKKAVEMVNRNLQQDSDKAKVDSSEKIKFSDLKFKAL